MAEEAVAPGFIGAHGHVGVHEEREGRAGLDTNELIDPVTAVRPFRGVPPNTRQPIE